MKQLSEFCCINPDCQEYGKRCGTNLRVHQTYGKSDTIRLLECKVPAIATPVLRESSHSTVRVSASQRQDHLDPPSS